MIELNAGQLRSGKILQELAGEATQSKRVVKSSIVGSSTTLNMNDVLDEEYLSDDYCDSKRKRKKQAKKKSKKKKSKKNESTSDASLSLLLLEDVGFSYISNPYLN